MLRLAARAASALVLASALALTVTTPAIADPPQPAATDIVGVGAGVTEMLLNQFSTDYNASLAAAGDTTSPRLYSWDSTGTPFRITTKTGATSIVRPYDSSNGIATLDATNGNTVDFARSARGPRADDPVTDQFVFMARDAVSWAAPAGGNAPTDLTSNDLRLIYGCYYTNWRQINPALPDAAIVPVLAVRGAALSDSSGFFLRTVTGSSVFEYGPCVRTVSQENQGTDPLLHDPNAIVPYSVGRYVGQVYGGHTRPGDEPGTLTVRSLNGISPVDTVNGQLRISFVSSMFGYPLYIVVRVSDWNSTNARGTALRAVFGRNGWVCRSNGGAPAIRSYGFLTMPVGGCGSTHS
ncbi:hypothetical protein ACIQ9P_38610 [Kitasatospora sp. NPDC094019]|uniref:hypothetical protein n=1 Tax=Kitasatospora sp. NPDC094019 TaxID=3364091 RepID=UPI003807D6F9